MSVSKDKYLQIFGIIVILLALYRCAHPGISGGKRVPQIAQTASSAQCTKTQYTQAM